MTPVSYPARSSNATVPVSLHAHELTVVAPRRRSPAVARGAPSGGQDYTALRPRSDGSVTSST